MLGTLQVVIAPCSMGDEVAALATPGAGMTGSGGEAIALVTAPTPTQLTTVAVAVATTQAAIGSGVTRRIQRFSPLQSQVRTKTHDKSQVIDSGPCLSESGHTRAGRHSAHGDAAADAGGCPGRFAPPPREAQGQRPRHGQQDDANPTRTETRVRIRGSFQVLTLMPERFIERAQCDLYHDPHSKYRNTPVSTRETGRLRMARKWVFGMAASLGAISAIGIQAAPALASSNVGPNTKSAIVGVLGYEGGGRLHQVPPDLGDSGGGVHEPAAGPPQEGGNTRDTFAFPSDLATTP